MTSISPRIQYWARWLLGIETFVKFIVAGGLTLVAGLWISVLFPNGSFVWLLGIAVSLIGSLMLLAGIWSEVEL